MTSPDLSIPEVCETEDRENQTASGTSEAGEISQSVKYIKKASDKVISKLYAEYEMIEQDKNNTILADVLITKFSDLMGMLQTVPSGDLLAAELREDKLLQGNIKTAVGFITPFVPFIVVITGGATLGKHMMKQRNEQPTTESA